MQEDIFTEAMERFNLAKEALADIHKKWTEDIKFALLNEQWTAQQLSDRQNEKRTSLVLNKLSPLIRQIVNTSMKNPPAIKVHAISQQNKEIATIYDGLVKHIQNESNAEDVYNQTLQDAVAGGIGVFEIIVDESSEIKIKRIVDPTSVYPDPSSTEMDFSDARWLFHMKKLPKDTFEKLYPNFDISSIDPKKSDWIEEDSITIAEYWVKKPNGDVCWYILNGSEVIDSSDSQVDEQGLPIPYPGKYIPYCFVVGETVFVEGRRHIKSAIFDSKEYQRTVNYMQSETIDYISKSAKAPWLVSDASILEYQDVWKNSNVKNLPYLPYHDGKAVPQRMDPPPPPIGYVDSIGRMDMDIKATMGVRDPLQDIPLTQSGKAIQLQMAQSNVATYVWPNHLNIAIKHAGRIIVDLIQYFYNYPHIQQILGIDGQVKSINIKTPYTENGEQKYIDLSGDYSVTISTGASYVDQRKETMDQLLELAKIDPRILQLAGDIVLRQMDFAESNEIADRFAAVIPPNVLAASQSGNSEAQMKQQLAIQSQKLEQAMQMVQQLTETLNNKSKEVQDIQSKLADKSEAAQIKAQTDLQKQAMNDQNELQKSQIDAYTREKEAQIKSDTELRIKAMELEIESLKSMFK